MTTKLVLIGGMPGSGKTYIGKELAKQAGLFVDKDTISRFFTEKILVDLGSNVDDRESDIYLSSIRDLEYETMMKHAFENLELGHNVLCSAPFIKEFGDKKWLDDMSFEAELLDSEMLKIWIHVDLPTARERIIARGASRDNWKLSNWEQYVSGLPEYVPEGDGVIVIDNTQSPEIPLFEKIDSVVKLISDN